MATTLERLTPLREVQGKTGPNYCLGSSKFFIGKLAGLFDPGKKWNDFMLSPWARKNRGKINLTAAWGLFRGAKDFNSKVLAAAISDPTAGVAAPGAPTGSEIEFYHTTDANEGNMLLLARVPLVIGVDCPGGSRRDHFISILRDSSAEVWVVDSWGEGNDYAFAQLPADFTFQKPAKADLNVAEGLTTVPCKPAWIGFYRNKTTKSPLAIKLAI